MYDQRTRTHQQQRVLYVWDGSNCHIQVADQFLKQLGEPRVYVVHALPHESIYSYGTVGQTFHKTSELERNLTHAFRQAVARTDHLKRASFQLLFGDRICEVTRFASLIKAKFVLTSLFEQSGFSRWIHGDLNTKFAKKLDCKVVFFGQEEPSSVVKKSDPKSMQRPLNEN